MRRGLKVVLGAAVVAATAVAGSSASRTGGVFDYWVDVQFSGMAQGISTFGKSTITETYSFEEFYWAHVESRSGIVNYVDPPSDLIGGDGFGSYSSSGAKNCTATFEPEFFKAGAGEGVRTWFGNQRADLGNPGPGNTLVSAMTDFGFVVGTPKSCLGSFALLAVPAAPELHCVVTSDRGCTDSWGSGERTVGCQAASSTCDRGNAQAKFVATPSPFPPDVLAEHSLLPYFDLPPLIPLWNWPPFPVPPPFLIPTGKTKPPVEDGDVEGKVWIAKQPLLTVKGRVKKGAKLKLPLRWSAAGVASARRITRPTLLTTRLTFTPAKGNPLTLTTTSYLMPHPKAGTAGGGGGGGGGGSTTPTIAAVSFGGTATNPTFVVHGKNLGTKPAPSPAEHPSGQDGCPVVAGDNGYDYGTNLYVVSNKGWSGGRSRPSANETDCIDLVVTKFTSSEVDFHFGPFYSKYASKFPLAAGDQIQVVVNGATKTVTR